MAITPTLRNLIDADNNRVVWFEGDTRFLEVTISDSQGIVDVAGKTFIMHFREKVTDTINIFVSNATIVGDGSTGKILFEFDIPFDLLVNSKKKDFVVEVFEDVATDLTTLFQKEVLIRPTIKD